MADITMCTQFLCPLAGSCYRRTATPSQFQSYAMFEYKISGNGVVCDGFYQNYQIKTSDRIENIPRLI